MKPGMCHCDYRMTDEEWREVFALYCTYPPKKIGTGKGYDFNDEEWKLIVKTHGLGNGGSTK